MESLIAPTTSSLSPLPSFSPKSYPSRLRHRLLPVASKGGGEKETDRRNDPSGAGLVPIPRKEMSLSPLSKEAAMGLVLGAAAGTGWTTGSGMEGPSMQASGSDPVTSNQVSTLPWSLFTKSPRRRMRVAFTCSVCGQRTTRAINPHAYTDGTVFVQCCGCNVFHKLVDNLNLFHEMKCYVSPSFPYKGDAPFDHCGEDDENGDMFPSI